MEHYSNVLKRKQTSILSFAVNTPQHMIARPSDDAVLKRAMESVQRDLNLEEDDGNMDELDDPFADIELDD